MMIVPGPYQESPQPLQEKQRMQNMGMIHQLLRIYWRILHSLGMEDIHNLSH